MKEGREGGRVKEVCESNVRKQRNKKRRKLALREKRDSILAL
jgi:hypothetical protein